MLRISYVIGKERTARSRGQGSRIKEKYIMVDNVGMMVAFEKKIFKLRLQASIALKKRYSKISLCFKKLNLDFARLILDFIFLKQRFGKSSFWKGIY